MSPRASAPTIPALKQAFLTNQTTLLAQPLAPSRSWQAANDASDEALSERVVEDVLFSLNHTIQQHCRRVYAPQASRNIAEQIDSVYTQDAERKVGGPADTEGGIGRELDLSKCCLYEIPKRNSNLIQPIKRPSRHCLLLGI